MESGLGTPGPCLPLPIKAPCLRAQAEEGLKPGGGCTLKAELCDHTVSCSRTGQEGHRGMNKNSCGCILSL